MSKGRCGLILFLCGVVIMLYSHSVQAGGGTYTEGTPDTLTINVVFEYDVGTDFDPNSDWENAFTRASQLLHNSTDGQVQFGTVNFFNDCPEVYDQADILIQSGSEGARAHPGGLGTDGLHLWVSNDLHTRDVSAARGQFGIVHEFGHYVFNLLDEYQDSNGNDVSCISPGSTVASIMDGGTTVQPKNQRTEWALAANAAACTNTEQFEKRGMIDWPWITQYVQSEYSATLTAPTSYDTSVPPGHQTVAFNYLECKVRAVVTVDRSGSMSGSPIETAKQGAQLFVDLSRDIDEFGVASFASRASVDYPINLMTDPGKTDAKAAIGGMSTAGNTNIGGGLQTSLNMITGQGDAVSNEVIVLLSDGKHNTGAPPDSVLSSLKSRGVTVYTIGLGTDADAELLSDIASETSGNYFFAPDVATLTSHFNSIFAQLRNDGVINSLSEDIQANDINDHPFEVDVYTEAGGEATFVVDWESGSLDLTLTRPDGTLVGDSDSDVSSHVLTPFSELYRIGQPNSGTWIARIASLSTATKYNIQVNSTAKSNVAVVATSDKGTYGPGESILVRTSVIAPARGSLEGISIAGAEVNGAVKLNGTSISAFTLYDDGIAAHGDDRADDGLYSNYFTPVGGGNYTFEIGVTNSIGTTTAPDEMDPSWVAEPVDPFTRQTEITVFVIGPQFVGYLPIILGDYLPPTASDIYGRVTENGKPVEDEEIMLRFDDGSGYTNYATSRTGARGEYRFSNLPRLGPNERFYVRWFNNDDNDNYLSTWACWTIDAKTTDPDAYRCDFDLVNVDLQSPKDSSMVNLPAMFSWQRRSLTTDDYEFNLADMDDYDPHWWSDPSLGYSESYTMTGLPAGFSTGKQYGWWAWIYGPDGYGLPYYYRNVTFSNNGLTSVDEKVSLATSSLKSGAEVIAPPRPQSINK